MKLQNVGVFGALALSAVLVSGCSGLQKTQSLVDAEKYFQEAKQNEEVLRYAPAELQGAEEALKKAAAADNKDDMTSLAYIASTRTQTAVSVAERKVLRAKQKELTQARDSARLDARDVEIGREKDARKRAQMEREAALADAEALRIANEQSLAEADALRAQNEQSMADAAALRAEKAKSLAEAEALRLEMEALQAVKTERGMVMTLGDVLFATAKADLQPGAMSTIERLAAFLAQYGDKTVLIEGHTDSVGAESYNQGLSEQRAASVKTALVAAGVDVTRISTIGLGESRPIAENDSAPGRLKNRRVEIVIQD